MEERGLGNSPNECALHKSSCYAKNAKAMDMQHKIAIIKQHLDRPIVLVGLMGAGKTKMGGMLARALDVPFTDADDEIVARAGLSIPEIFEKHGESRFRELEADVIGGLITSRGGVISTGGGAVMTPRSADLIFSDQALSVWIRAPLSVHVERTTRHGGRPLLANADPSEKLGALMAARDPVYARADVTIDNGQQDAKVTLEEMISALYHYLAS